jgi:two-component system OmpR family response regulator
VPGRPGSCRILVVEDDVPVAASLRRTLEYAGFEVMLAHEGPTALAVAGRFAPDLVVLDVMLPDLDGFAIARRLRDGRQRVPIIFLTAKDAPEDKLEGLSLGDDYVTKPFSLAEMVARVRTVLRRTRAEQDEAVLEFADLVLNEETREVWRRGESVELTPTEFNLLRFLMLNPRRVLTKRQILDNVWHYDFGGDANVVETYVSYLRKKLDRLGPPLIHTVRLVGYALRDVSQ